MHDRSVVSSSERGHVGLQLTGPVPGTYDTLRPFGANTANIGAIVIVTKSSALAPTSASINNQTCNLVVSTYYEELG